MTLDGGCATLTCSVANVTRRRAAGVSDGVVLRRLFFGLTCLGVASLATACPGANGGSAVPGSIDATADGASDAGIASDAPLEAEAGSPPHIDCPAELDAGADAGPVRVRIMTANTTSGAQQAYEAPGIHIFQGLAPDIALVQEFNYRAGTTRELVNTAFGPQFCVYRDPRSGGIPNGIVSRFRIVDAGDWTDPDIPDRAFTYARIDVPGPIDLWAVSVHLKTSNVTTRIAEAKRLVAYIQAAVPAGDYVVVGGDLNTDVEFEQTLAELSAIVVTASPFAVDQNANNKTNAPRAKPYDWLLASPALDAKRAAVTIGASSFAAGLVFDSRVYMPLADVAPILATDSAATNMQHMPVVKEFVLGN